MLPVSLYPNYKFERPQLEAYYEIFKDYDVTKEQLFSAIKLACKGSEFFPTVAGILEHLDRQETYTPPAFNRQEIENPKAVPMPPEIKAQLEKLLTKISIDYEPEVWVTDTP